MRARSIALAVATALAAASPAAADWSAPETVATGADGGPRLALSQSGRALLVWRSGDSLLYARAGRGRPLSTPAAVPGAQAAAILDEDDFAVEADEEGNAILAWPEFSLSYSEPDICCNRLHASAARAFGPFAEAAKLPDQDEVTSYDVDVDPLGAAAVAWNDGISSWIATAPEFGAVGGSAKAVANCGAGEVALTAYPGVEELIYTCEPRARLRARTMRADGPGPARIVAPGGPHAGVLVESDRAFHQLGVWYDEDFPPGPLRAGVRRDRGPFRGVRVLGRSSDRTILAPADLAVAPRGHGLAVLYRFMLEGRGSLRALVARRSPGRGFGRLVALARSAALGVPAGAVGDGGDAAVVWAAVEGHRIVVARGAGLRSRRSFALMPPLSEEQRNGCPMTDVGVDRRGDVLVVWRDHGAIRVARYTAP